jgi:hypothetical protein
VYSILSQLNPIRTFTVFVLDVVWCLSVTKSSTPIAKAVSNKLKMFHQQTGHNLGKELVKCNIWSVAVYDAEPWTLGKVDQNFLESFEMCWWKRTEKSSWTDRVRKWENIT